MKLNQHVSQPRLLLIIGFCLLQITESLEFTARADIYGASVSPSGSVSRQGQEVMLTLHINGECIQTITPQEICLPDPPIEQEFQEPIWESIAYPALCSREVEDYRWIPYEVCKEVETIHCQQFSYVDDEGNTVEWEECWPVYTNKCEDLSYWESYTFIEEYACVEYRSEIVGYKTVKYWVSPGTYTCTQDPPYHVHPQVHVQWYERLREFPFTESEIGGDRWIDVSGVESFHDQIGVFPIQSADYFCIITGCSTSADVTSEVATVVVVPNQPEIPTVAQGPIGGEVPYGTITTLSVSAVGIEPLSYQWFQGALGNDNNPVGANEPTFTTPALTMDTSYWVRVSNSGGSSDVPEARLTVLRKDWQIGTRNSSYAEFSLESGRADPPPGRVSPPAAPDDFFYFAGEYPIGDGGDIVRVSDEPSSAWERALGTFGGDVANRFIFKLQPSQVIPGATFRLSFGFAGGGWSSRGVFRGDFSQHDISVRFNSTVLAPPLAQLPSPIIVTGPAEFSAEFLASSVNAVAGANTIEFERIGPSVPGNDYYVLFDYVRLEDTTHKNLPPVIAPIANVEVKQYKALRLSMTATDDATTQGDLRFFIVSGPPTLTISLNGQMEWSPGADTIPGDYPVIVGVRDGGLDSLIGQTAFTITVTPALDVPVPQIVSQYPIASGGSVMLRATATGGANPIHYQWFQGLPGDTQTPVGGDSSEFTSPSLFESTGYWVRATDSSGLQGDSWSILVEVPPFRGSMVELTGAVASVTASGQAALTLADPAHGSWSPGAEASVIVWKFDRIVGGWGYASLQLELAFQDVLRPPQESLGAFRLYYTTSDHSLFGVGSDVSGTAEWHLLNISGGVSTDGSEITHESFLGLDTISVLAPAGETAPIYRVFGDASSLASPITGIRLDSIKGDIRLPGSGPGRGANGEFSLSELQLTDLTPPPPLQKPHLTSGTAVLPGHEFGLEVSVPPGLQAFAPQFEWFLGEKGDLSHSLSRTDVSNVVIPGIAQSSLIWVRLTTANGTSDSDSLAIPVGDLSLQLLGTTACSEAEVLIPVRARDFVGVGSLQGSIQWDPTVAACLGPEGFNLPNLSTANFVVDSERGVLRLVWWDETLAGATVENDTDLFTIRFKLVGGVDSLSALEFTSSPTPWEVFDATGDTLTPVLKSTNLRVAGGNMTLSGTIKYFSGDGARLPDVYMATEFTPPDGRPTDGASYNSHGAFSFLFPTCYNEYRLETFGYMEVPPYEGITMLDAHRVREHLLGTRRLRTSMEYLAADMDFNSRVNVADLRRIVLAVLEPAAGTWLVLRSDFTPEIATEPWAWRNERTRFYHSLTTNLVGQDFVAIKVGDVDGSLGVADPGLLPLRSLAKLEGPGSPMRLELSQQTGEINGSIKVAAICSGADLLTTAQFSVNWDPTVLHFLGVENYGLRGMSEGSFGVQEGTLSLAWDDPLATGVSTVDGHVLFNVLFSAISASEASTPVHIADFPTRGELSIAGKAVPYTSSSGLVIVTSPNNRTLGMTKASSGEWGFSFNVPAGLQWVLESSEDLRNWTAVTLPAESAGEGAINFQVPETGQSHRFYRVLQYP